MTEEKIPKKRGRKPKGRRDPLLASKVPPEVFDWAKSRPEGTRRFIERLVLEDKAKALGWVAGDTFQAG